MDSSNFNSGNKNNSQEREGSINPDGEPQILVETNERINSIDIVENSPLMDLANTVQASHSGFSDAVQSQQNRPDSAQNQQNRPGSAQSQQNRPGSVQSQQNRPGSAQNQQNRPGSVQSQQKRPGSAQSQQNRPGSAQSQQNRPGSAQSQQSRSGSAQSQQSCPGSAQSQQNRPGSAQMQQNRPGSAQSQEDRPGSAQSQGDRPGSAQMQQNRPGSAQSQEDRPGSAQSQGDRPGSAQSQEDRPGSAQSQGDRPGSTQSQEDRSGSAQSQGDRPSLSLDSKQTNGTDTTLHKGPTILDIDPISTDEDTTADFRTAMDPFPVMSDHLFMIEEEEEPSILQNIDEFSSEFGGKGDDVVEPAEEIDVPDLLEKVHVVPTRLASTEPPQALFEDERIPDTIQRELNTEYRLDYLNEFDSEVKEDVLMIGNISLEEIKEEEQRLREEHVRFQDQQAQVHARQQKAILHQTENAKEEMSNFAKVKRKELSRKEQQIREKKRLYQSEVQQAYRRAEAHLLYAIKKRRAEVETMFGDLVLADSQYGGNKGRRWKVDWNKAPQPVQIKLRCLRGIKDKLPSGRYVVLVSMYDRIGGHVLRWSNLTGQQWSGSTLPLHHNGLYSSIELEIEQSVFTVCPSTPEVRPSMVFVFEVFLLRGAVIPTDRVVAWGAFPLSDKDCSIIEGKYKCPLLRGEIDMRIQSHDKVEMLIAKDLDNWMCNLYFEVTKLPRYMGGQKEFEVELQFSSSLLGYPDRLNQAEDPKDGNPPISEDDGDVLTTVYDPASFQDSQEQDTLRKPGSVQSAQSVGAVNQNIIRPFTAVQEMLSDSEDSGERRSDGENDYENEFEQVKDKPGLYYKVHREHPMESYHATLYKMLPRTALMHPPLQAKTTLSKAEELAEYQFAIHLPFNEKTKQKKVPHERFQFVWLQILTEVGVSKFRTPEFWTLIFFMFVSGLGRMLIHYSGQYLLLWGLDARVSKFEVQWHSCRLIYYQETLNSFDVAALVLFGPMSNIFIFILIVAIAGVSARLAGYFPDLASHFISAFGVMTIIDWLIVLIVDCFNKRYDGNQSGMEGIVGDAFKLYQVFDRTDSNGLVGAFLTVFIYLFTTFLSSVIFYIYYLRIHLNGRLLDIFVRLTGDQDSFFVPYDLEISHAELDYIITKSEQWRGEEGERRKITIYDYIWEEEVEEDWGENEERTKLQSDITTHISIHTLHLDGLRELYRHFLRLSDGAILEVFGDGSNLGLDETVKSQLKERFDDMEGYNSPAWYLWWQEKKQSEVIILQYSQSQQVLKKIKYHYYIKKKFQTSPKRYDNV